MCFMNTHNIVSELQFHLVGYTRFNSNEFVFMIFSTHNIYSKLLTSLPYNILLIHKHRQFRVIHKGGSMFMVLPVLSGYQKYPVFILLTILSLLFQAVFVIF